MTTTSQVLGKTLEQIASQPYNEEIIIEVYGFKKIELTYSKRYVNGKEFGQFNDFQSYESLDIKTVVNILKNKRIPFSFVVKIQRCKSLVTFEKVLKSIDEGLN